MGFAENIKSLFLSVDDEYDDMVDYQQPEVRQQAPQPVAQKPMTSQYYEEDMIQSQNQALQQRKMPSNKVMAMPNTHVRTSQVNKMILRKPTTFDEAKEIGYDIKAQKTVFLNLENASIEVSGSLMKFLSGVAFAMDGQVEKIGSGTYIIAPYDADLVGENFESNGMDELENPGVYYN